MIIETSANQLYAVKELPPETFPHVWLGVEVKRVRGEYVRKGKRRPHLVRKDSSRIVDAIATVEVANAEGQ